DVRTERVDGLHGGLQPQAVVKRKRRRGPSPTLVRDDDEPCRDDRALWTAAASSTSRCWWRCVRRWRRSGTALGLEEIRVVRLRIDGDRLCTGEGVDGRDRRVLVG